MEPRARALGPVLRGPHVHHDLCLLRDQTLSFSVYIVRSGGYFSIRLSFSVYICIYVVVLERRAAAASGSQSANTAWLAASKARQQPPFQATLKAPFRGQPQPVEPPAASSAPDPVPAPKPSQRSSGQRIAICQHRLASSLESPPTATLSNHPKGTVQRPASAIKEIESQLCTRPRPRTQAQPEQQRPADRNLPTPPG